VLGNSRWSRAYRGLGSGCCAAVARIFRSPMARPTIGPAASPTKGVHWPSGAKPKAIGNMPRPSRKRIPKPRPQEEWLPRPEPSTATCPSTLRRTPVIPGTEARVSPRARPMRPHRIPHGCRSRLGHVDEAGELAEDLNLRKIEASGRSAPSASVGECAGQDGDGEHRDAVPCVLDRRGLRCPGDPASRIDNERIGR
jgi:hypothetical protein